MPHIGTSIYQEAAVHHPAAKPGLPRRSASKPGWRQVKTADKGLRVEDCAHSDRAEGLRKVIKLNFLPQSALPPKGSLWGERRDESIFNLFSAVNNERCLSGVALAKTEIMNTGYISLTQLNRDSTLDMRSKADKIRKLAQNLSEPDRTLVRMYLDHENSFRQMAQLLGVSEATVARRVKKIIGRIGDRNIDGVLAKSSKLSRRQKKIARDYFLRGLNVKKIARKYKMTYYNTQRIINLLRKFSTQRRHKTTIRYY